MPARRCFPCDFHPLSGLFVIPSKYRFDEAETAEKGDHDDLFKAWVNQIINMKHELLILADKIDWAWLDEGNAPYFSEQG